VSELSFRGVTVRYGHGRHARVAVDDVTLTVPSGKVVGLVGESGSGKTTLGRAAIGFVPLAGGEVTVDGERLRRATSRRRPRVQMVFQDPFSSLDPRMTIGSSIAEAMPLKRRRNRAAAKAEVARLLSLVNLDSDRAGALPRTLSGGQRQRVALARALAAEPGVIVADEITAALDVSVQGTVLNLVRDLQRELQLSMLFISHNLAVVRYVSDIIAVMYRGRIVELGPTAAVLENPRHPYTSELLAAIPHRGESLLAARPSDAVRADAARSGSPAARSPGPGCPFADRCPIGPSALPGRAVCLEVDPFQAMPQQDHRAACHFAPTRSRSSC
jgi:peptide/nickel transport system ATP-binding protein